MDTTARPPRQEPGPAPPIGDVPGSGAPPQLDPINPTTRNYWRRLAESEVPSDASFFGAPSTRCYRVRWRTELEFREAERRRGRLPFAPCDYTAVRANSDGSVTRRLVWFARDVHTEIGEAEAKDIFENGPGKKWGYFRDWSPAEVQAALTRAAVGAP